MSPSWFSLLVPSGADNPDFFVAVLLSLPDVVLVCTPVALWPFEVDASEFSPLSITVVSVTEMFSRSVVPSFSVFDLLQDTVIAVTIKRLTKVFLKVVFMILNFDSYKIEKY